MQEFSSRSFRGEESILLYPSRSTGKITEKLGRQHAYPPNLLFFKRDHAQFLVMVLPGFSQQLELFLVVGKIRISNLSNVVSFRQKTFHSSQGSLSVRSQQIFYYICSRERLRTGEIFLASFPFFSMTFVFGTDLRPGPRDTKDTISRVPRPPREQLIFFQSYIYWSDILVQKEKKEREKGKKRTLFFRKAENGFFFFF